MHVCTLRGETRKITMQALSNEERKGWLEIMEGKEPVSPVGMEWNMIGMEWGNYIVAV